MSASSSPIKAGATFGHPVLIATSLAAGLALEIWALILFLNAAPPLLPSDPAVFGLLGMHLASCLLISAGLYLAAARKRLLCPQNWLIMSLVMSVVFPAIGPFGMLAVFFVFFASPSERSGAYDEYSKYITYDFKPQEKYMPSDKLMEGISQELEVSPLVEVLGEGDSNTRRGVVNVVEKLPKKDAIRLLKGILEDRSVEVRYLAASELSRIETEFNENVFMARKEVDRKSTRLNSSH